MKAIALVLSAALLASCASTPREAAGPQPRRGYKFVKFESAPPGARVFISYGTSHKDAAKVAGDYLGTTPCTAEIAIERDGSFAISKKIAFVNNFGEPRTALIYAQIGDTSITNAFHASAFAREGDRVPDSMFFDFARP